MTQYHLICLRARPYHHSGEAVLLLLLLLLLMLLDWERSDVAVGVLRPAPDHMPSKGRRPGCGNETATRRFARCHLTTSNDCWH